MPRTRAALAATALALPALAAALTACGPGTPHVIGTDSTPTSTPTDSGPSPAGTTAHPTYTPTPHGPPPVLVDCTHHGHVRPASYVTACADANNAVTRLRWTSWRPGHATGTGVERSNDCTPNCAAGHFHVYPVRVAVAAPKPWPGHDRHYFTRMKVVFTGAHPGPSRTETYHLTT